MGAADYVVKPCSPMELVGRARAALWRRLEPFAGKLSASCDVGWLTIDYPQRRAALAGESVELTATEYAAHAARVLSCGSRFSACTELI